MPFTYSGDPSTSMRDAVRFLLNDTDSTDVLLTDAEISYLIAEWVNVYAICRAGAETLASKFIRLAESSSKGVGDINVSESYQNKASQYRDLAMSFHERQMRKSPPAPWANADALKSTTDRTVETYPTDFHVGMDDNG